MIPPGYWCDTSGMVKMTDEELVDKLISHPKFEWWDGLFVNVEWDDGDVPPSLLLIEFEREMGLSQVAIGEFVAGALSGRIPPKGGCKMVKEKFNGLAHLLERIEDRAKEFDGER